VIVLREAYVLLGEATRFKRLVAEHGYGANRFRSALKEAGMKLMIPGRINHKRPIRHAGWRYGDR
jgi:hypothetical protein